MTAPATRRYGGLALEARKADRRARLLAAGLELFGTAGYAAGSVERICEQAGLSTRQFYDEFTNRDELLLALYDDVNDRARAAVEEATTDSRSADVNLRERLHRTIGAYVATTAADPRWAQLAYVTIVGVNAHVEEHRQARRAAWTDVLCTLTTELADQGQLPRQDLRLTMRAFIGAVNELVHTWCRTEPQPPIHQITNTLVHILHSAITIPIQPPD